MAAVVLVVALVLHAPQRIAHWWSCNSGGPGAPSWSPDGRWIAFAAIGKCDTEIVAVQRDGAGRHVIANSFAFWPVWSPTGRDILVNTHSGYSVMSVAEGKLTIVIHGASDIGAAWSPDGRRIAFTDGSLPSPGGDYESTLFVANRDGSARHRLIGQSCDPGGPAWSPDGTAIAVGCYDGLYVLDLKSHTIRRVLKDDFGFDPPTPSWSPDGRLLAFVEADYGVSVVSADGSGKKHLLASVASHGWTDTAAWSPDGRWIAYSISTGARTDGLYVMRSDGRDAHRIARF